MDNKFKDLKEFYEAIDIGLDIEFILRDVRYNISWENYKPFICTCPDGDATVYDDAQDLLDNFTIDKVPIKKLWNEIDIISM